MSALPFALRAYAVATTLISPFLPLWLAKRAARGKEETARLKERYGITSLTRPSGKLVWMHAASVGESQSLLPVAQALRDAQPNLTLLITTGTVTSAKLVANWQLPNVIHQFVPIDAPRWVVRFLGHWQPDMALWVESELWPNLILATKARGIPMLLVNARMSERSYERWRNWQQNFRALAACFEQIHAGSIDDRRKWRNLGAPAEYYGNLKFDAPALAADPATASELLAMLGDRPMWLAASTHEGEEMPIAAAHKTLQPRMPALLTVLVPRHPARGDSIAAALRAEDFRVAQRSRGELIEAHTQIYLADTLGELGLFYRMAPLAFIGGSLVPVGGHNFLEAAKLDCALLSGTHTHNFQDIAAELRAEGGLMIVEDTEVLAWQVERLLHDAPSMARMADAAKQVALARQGAAKQVVSAIEAHLGLRD